MKFLLFVATAVIAAEAVSASSIHSGTQEDSVSHLFTRQARRTPVELYKGVDPQLHLVQRDRRELSADSPRRRGHDFLEISNHAPSDKMKRQATQTSPGTGTAYPPAGSNSPPASSLPQAWVDKYNAVKKQGLIPDIQPAKEGPDGMPSYPAGTDMKKACSWTLSKCQPEGTIYQAPGNSIALGVDDGPTPDGTPLYLDVFKSENVTATHFLIGSTCMWNSDILKTLAGATPKQNLGVHTWSHTLQTTKTDMEVLGDLGWTMQIIYDYAGVIPAFWRPPEGDTDARVSAIAKYVFGMQTVMWTHDADDWCLRQGTGTAKEIQSCVQSAPDLDTVQKTEVGWFSPKNSNDGQITLNHETTDQASKAFRAMVQAIKKESWTLEGAVPNLQGLPWYNNAYGPNDTPTKQDNILPTRDIVNVTDGTAAKGSPTAPKLGNWAKTASMQNPAVSAQATGSNASGSAKSNGFSTSGVASSIEASLALIAFAIVSAGVTLLA